MSRAYATATGFTAILMWALLAWLTAASGAVPPFQLAAMTFAIGGTLGLAWTAARGRLIRLRQPPRAWLVGVGGLFGYHFLYFTALRNAPPAEASLIGYLWPLLIVIGSALLPGERLRPHHVLGALLGLAGTALIVTRGDLGLSGGGALGYGAAFLSAVTWAVYSIASRTLRNVPSEAVAGFCLATAALSLLCHLALEATSWPSGTAEWLAIAALGLMPVGAAFYVWDHGVKHGDIQVLGAASYAAPLLSTLVLVAAGRTVPDAVLVGACLCITLGAVIAAKDMILRPRRAA